MGFTMSRRSQAVAIALTITLALSASACGRRGAPIPPNAAPTAQEKSQADATSGKASSADSGGITSVIRGDDTPTPVPQPSSNHFFLDWLL